MRQTVIVATAELVAAVVALWSATAILGNPNTGYRDSSVDFHRRDGDDEEHKSSRRTVSRALTRGKAPARAPLAATDKRARSASVMLLRRAPSQTQARSVPQAEISVWRVEDVLGWYLARTISGTNCVLLLLGGGDR